MVETALWLWRGKLSLTAPTLNLRTVLWRWGGPESSQSARVVYTQPGQERDEEEPELVIDGRVQLDPCRGGDWRLSGFGAGFFVRNPAPTPPYGFHPAAIVPATGAGPGFTYAEGTGFGLGEPGIDPGILGDFQPEGRIWVPNDYADDDGLLSAQDLPGLMYWPGLMCRAREQASLRRTWVDSFDDRYLYEGGELQVSAAMPALRGRPMWQRVALGGDATGPNPPGPITFNVCFAVQLQRGER